MYSFRSLVPIALAISVSAILAPLPAGASTFIRMGLETLTAENDLVVLGKVVDLHSYWNTEKTHILTDVRVHSNEILKGAAGNEVRFTLFGGTVGEWSTLVIGGPEIEAGTDYLLFLTEVDMPGAGTVLTVRDHAQGVFDVKSDAASGARAVSQAMKHGLVPDAAGRDDAPGGEAGLPLAEMVRQVRDLAQ